MSTEVNTAEEYQDRPRVEDSAQDITLDDRLPFAPDERRTSKQDWERFKLEVKSRSRLEDVIHADWDRRSPTDWWCSSPLRPDQDSTPSFHINPERQVWKDFGLDERGGDVFAYLQQLWNCSFMDALTRRAAELNISVPSSTLLTEKEQAELGERELVETILTEAAACYNRGLTAEVRAHLNDHYGFTDATIDELKIGFDDGTLYEALKSAGYSDHDMALTGLFGNGEKDRTRFEGRITFPYWRAGRVLYFAARQTKHTPAFIKGDKDVTPKYLKLKTGPTGDELSWVSRSVTNDHFWGEDCAGRRLDLLLIAEGMPDAISAHQAGFNVISPVTVQFRDKDHAKLLKLTKKVKRVVLVPDQEANGAGMKGAVKTCTFLCKHGVDARILVLPHAAEQASAEAEAEQLKQSGAAEHEVKNAADWKVDLNEWMRRHSRDDLQQLIELTPGHIQSMIKALPEDLDPDERDARLRPILDLVAAKPASSHENFINLIKQRVGGTKKVLQAILTEQLAELAQDAGAGNDDEHAHGGFALTDVGNADRFYARAGQLVRYVPEWKCFLVFNGKLWRRDQGGHVVRRLATEMVKAELAAARKIDETDARQVVVEHWTRSQGRRALDNLVELLKDQRGVCIEPKQLDVHPYLLNFQNGTLDLKTRTRRPHDPADLLTKVIEHNYDPSAAYPNFMRYLEGAA